MASRDGPGKGSYNHFFALACLSNRFFSEIIVLATQAGDEIGYGWLALRYGVTATQPLAVESRIGRTRHTHEFDGRRHEAYLEAMWPADTLGGHLTFALKHEGVHLELLARRLERLVVEGFSDVSERA